MSSESVSKVDGIVDKLNHVLDMLTTELPRLQQENNTLNAELSQLRANYNHLQSITYVEICDLKSGLLALLTENNCLKDEVATLRIHRGEASTQGSSTGTDISDGYEPEYHCG
ncbi:hypothetical protein BD777DRAFT_129997 [Yarrowia lipolytica]|nr:hypothetical protein BD777DRAFT_129997 [Yarrowia lipolytica]